MQPLLWQSDSGTPFGTLVHRDYQVDFPLNTETTRKPNPFPNPYSFWVAKMEIILQDNIVHDSETVILPIKHILVYFSLCCYVWSLP